MFHIALLHLVYIFFAKSFLNYFTEILSIFTTANMFLPLVPFLYPDRSGQAGFAGTA